MLVLTLPVLPVLLVLLMLLARFILSVSAALLTYSTDLVPSGKPWLAWFLAAPCRPLRGESANSALS